MSPRMEPDFEWTDVQATTPVYPKGDYELTVKSVRGSAWAKTDKEGNPTGAVVRVVRFKTQVVGVYDSKNKLKTEQNGRTIKDLPADDINIWVHSEGGRRMGKKYMMAIIGFDPNEPAEETKFNEWLAKQGVDLSARLTENDDGGYGLAIGDGWEALFVGKNVKASLDVGVSEREGQEPQERQEINYLVPVNKAS